MEDKKFEEIPSSFLQDTPNQSTITPFGSSQGGFMVNENDIDDLLNDGGSPVTEEKPLPIPKEKKAEGEAPTPPEEAPKKETDEELINQFFDEEETPETPAPVTPTKEPEATEPETPEVNDFQVLAESLLEYGIFTKTEEDEEPITSGEQLKERWEKEKEIQVNSKIYDFLMTKHGQEGVDVFDSIFVKGANPKDFLAKYDTVQSFKEVDLSSEANQEAIYRAYQRKQGWPEEKINKYVEKYKSLGELEELSRDVHEELVKLEEEELSEMAEEAEVREQQRIQQENFYQQKVGDILKDKLKAGDFDGIPVTQKTAQETYSYLVQKRFRLPSGELLTTFDKDILELRKPDNYELKLKIALLLRDGFDLTKVKAKAVTQTKDKYFDKVIRENKTQSRKNPINSNQNPSSFLEHLKYNK